MAYGLEDRGDIAVVLVQRGSQRLLGEHPQRRRAALLAVRHGIQRHGEVVAGHTADHRDQLDAVGDQQIRRGQQLRPPLHGHQVRGLGGDEVDGLVDKRVLPRQPRVPHAGGDRAHRSPGRAIDEQPEHAHSLHHPVDEHAPQVLEPLKQRPARPAQPGLDAARVPHHAFVELGGEHDCFTTHALGHLGHQLCRGHPAFRRFVGDPPVGAAQPTRGEPRPAARGVGGEPLLRRARRRLAGDRMHEARAGEHADDFVDHRIIGADGGGEFVDGDGARELVEAAGAQVAAVLPPLHDGGGHRDGGGGGVDLGLGGRPRRAGFLGVGRGQVLPAQLQRQRDRRNQGRVEIDFGGFGRLELDVGVVGISAGIAINSAFGRGPRVAAAVDGDGHLERHRQQVLDRPLDGRGAALAPLAGVEENALAGEQQQGLLDGMRRRRHQSPHPVRRAQKSAQAGEQLGVGQESGALRIHDRGAQVLRHVVGDGFGPALPFVDEPQVLHLPQQLGAGVELEQALDGRGHRRILDEDLRDVRRHVPHARRLLPGQAQVLGAAQELGDVGAGGRRADARRRLVAVVGHGVGLGSPHGDGGDVVDRRGVLQDVHELHRGQHIRRGGGHRGLRGLARHQHFGGFDPRQRSRQSRAGDAQEPAQLRLAQTSDVFAEVGAGCVIDPALHSGHYGPSAYAMGSHPRLRA